jgi:hypothetical protein
MAVQGDLMHKLAGSLTALTAIAVVAVLAPPTASADKAYNQGKGGAWDCANDPAVKINTSNGSFVITGTCKRITINGNTNTVTADTTAKLDVNGNSNTIEAKQADVIVTTGNDNKLHYGNPGAKTSNVGRGNKLVAGGSGGGSAGPAPAAKTKPAGDAKDIDCSKTPTFTITDGAGTYSFIGTCDTISVTGGENTLTIEAVKELSIAGADNTIDVSAVDKINAVGNGNKIHYKTGVSGNKPKIHSLGQHNTIEQVK